MKSPYHPMGKRLHMWRYAHPGLVGKYHMKTRFVPMFSVCVHTEVEEWYYCERKPKNENRPDNVARNVALHSVKVFKTGWQ